MIDWNKPVCTPHATPYVGRLLQSCPVHGRQRVAVSNANHQSETVYRYDDDGKSRGDGAPSNFDLVNFSPADGVERLNPAIDPKQRAS